MTDKDIIKALECCFVNKNCNGCPQVGKSDCLGSACVNALDLINRQKAEIEWLNKTLVFEINSAFERGKAEAITEFAESLTIHFGTYTDKDCVKVFEMVRLIDQTAKEMKGEQ